jgi:uncharacterized protein
MPRNRKIIKLHKILSNMGSCLVAFSGGVDSSFLLKVAKDSLGGNLLAVTAVSPTYPREELLFSRKIAKSFGVRHKIIHTNELSDNNFLFNPANRCYFCKKELFLKLNAIAKKEALGLVVDASNFSDKKDYRPGDKAKKELNVRSPLQEAGLTKEDIRILSKKMKLATWNMPSLACLASRIPYGTKVSPGILKRIDSAEKYLRSLGFSQVRVRHYGDLCRIEVHRHDLKRLIGMATLLVEKLKRLGYNYVTVDLEGYMTGSMNSSLSKKDKIGYK